MRRSLLSLALLAALAAPADAEPRGAHSQPTPATVGVTTDAGTSDDPVREAAKAHQDAFDKRIATRSEQAIRSICQGCEAGPARARPAPRRVEAKAGPARGSGNDVEDDVVVDEPAESPGN